jgi:hypothetical protein
MAESAVNPLLADMAPPAETDSRRQNGTIRNHVSIFVKTHLFYRSFSGIVNLKDITSRSGVSLHRQEPARSPSAGSPGCRSSAPQEPHPPGSGPTGVRLLRPFACFAAWFAVVFSSPSTPSAIIFPFGATQLFNVLPFAKLIFSASIPPADTFALVTAPSAIDRRIHRPHFHPLGHKRVGARAELLTGRQFVGVHFHL